MFDWTTQLRFGVEFATFLVAVAGAFVLLVRPQLIGVATARARALLTLGLVGLAVAAFLHGSLVSEDTDLPVVLVRGASIIVLGLGTFGLREDPRTRRVLWVALVLLAAAEGTNVSDYESFTQVLRGLGAVGLGAMLVVSARRSISARMAVSTAATLLVVVLGVSVGLSAVIADNLADSAQRRVANRATAEADQIESSTRAETVVTAQLVALSLQGNRAELLLARSADPRPEPAIQGDLDLLTSTNLLATRGPLLYLNDDRRVIAFSGLDAEQAAMVAGLPAAQQLTGPGGPDSASEVTVVEGRVLVFGYHVIRLPGAGGDGLVGVVVAGEPLDEALLAAEAQDDPDVSLALVNGGRVLAASGASEIDVGDVIEVAQAAVDLGGEAARVTGNAFVAARVVTSADPASSLVLVSAAPSRPVDDARRTLFQRLFLIALVTVQLVLAVTIVVGERINRQLRRLTRAAEGIRRGDLSVRAAVPSQDELGLLGDAFDSMAGSIEAMAYELRQAADEETRLRTRLEAVVAGMGEALVAVDADGQVIIFNDAAEELFALPATAVVGRPMGEALSITSDRGTDVADRLARPLPGSWSDAAQAVRSDGVAVPVALSAGGLRDAGGDTVGGVYVLRDMRRDREVDRMKTEFLSNISHELRTPLVPIRGFAELLRTRQVPKAQAQEFLDRILEASSELERVVDLLVSVAADEAARLTLRQESVDVRALVDTVVERWKAKAGDDHRIVRRVDRHLPPLVGDRRLLERALDELLANAVKYSPGGGRVLVTASVASVEAEDEFVAWTEEITLTVRDEGLGIPADRLADIFGDFAQADASPTRRFGGMGLGLAFVRRIVRAHRGTLQCQSEPARGSTFTIVLPATPRLALAP